MAIYKKPTNITEFQSWAKSTLGFDFNRSIEGHYDANTRILKDRIEKEIFEKYNTNYSDYEKEYEIKNKYDLFAKTGKIELKIKTFDGLLSKIFRKNVVENINWPDPPRGGWITENNFWNRINDIIRCDVVVKYLDGAEFIKNKLGLLAKEYQYNFEEYFEARENGYYAIHTYFKKNQKIKSLLWDDLEISFKIEVQITTQLQEVIKKLLHKYYDEKRSKEDDVSKKKWQWNYGAEEFSVNYLGHILHYLEGMIMEIRLKKEKE